MTRTERRKLERQHAKQSKKLKVLYIDVASTLEQATISAEKANAGSFQFNNKLYLRNEWGWKEYDVLSKLLTFPQYKKIYNDVLLETDGNSDIAANVVLSVFTTNNN
jgi:hypothetical protein